MANSIITYLVTNNGECYKKLDEWKLKEILTENGVPFFPGFYDAPHDIWDVFEAEQANDNINAKSKLTPTDIRRFQQIIRHKNLNKANMVVVNKNKVAKAADLLEIGEMIGVKERTELSRFMSKMKRLELINDSYNDKLDRVEYYINPCFRKPGSRLSVDLYGLFRHYLYKAMTVKENKYSDIQRKIKRVNGKMVMESVDVTSDSYRDMIEQVYQSQRQTTVDMDDAQRIVNEIKVSVVRSKADGTTKELDYLPFDEADPIEMAKMVEEEDESKILTMKDIESCVETISGVCPDVRIAKNKIILSDEKAHEVRKALVTFMSEHCSMGTNVTNKNKEKLAKDTNYILSFN